MKRCFQLFFISISLSSCLNFDFNNPVETRISPSAPILLSPIYNSINQPIMPTLSWNSSSEATSYTLQASTNNTFSSFVYNQSGLTRTNQQISELANSTQYYWRVSASNSYGASDWSSVWSFTTASGGVAPEIPILSSPINIATNVAIPPSLNWNSSSGATSYTLQVSTNNTFSSFIYNHGGLTGTSQQISELANSTQYYWRLNASNNFGTSDWSNVWSFTTASGGVAPEIPILSSPINKATNVAIPPSLNWNSSSGATSYTLQVSTNNTFSSFVYNQSGLTGTSHQISGLANSTQYYWRVSASNSYGTSDWSTGWNFTTSSAGVAPDIPILSSPATNTTEIPVPPTLFWNQSNNTESYSLQVSANGSFTSIVFDGNGLTSTSQLISGLKYSTKYYWHIKAANSFGFSAWSTTWNFTTIGIAPQPPILSSPANNSTDISTSPTLSWFSSSGATGYILQVSESNTFSTFIYNADVGNVVIKPITGLNNTVKYYWRMKATNAYGSSDWSTAWNFITMEKVPESPILSSPANNSTDVLISPSLSWNASNGATSYTLQVSASSTFSSPIYDGGVGSVLNKQILGLSNSTKYYWRVSALNNYGTSNWSAVWNFTTEGGMGYPCPGTPTINHEGKTYNTVQIKDQCWLKENLNVGTMIDTLSDQTNNGVIEKYCYLNNTSYCDSYGGFYQWDEAMAYTAAPGTRGICPSGWHIPYYEELQTLTTNSGGGNALKAIGQGTGYGAGTNTSGFSALLAGSNGRSYGFGLYAYFWSFTAETDAGFAYFIELRYQDSYIAFAFGQYSAGFSVRCLKD
ncbi:MAG: FISUMP domain-containing protein [bacterium]